MPLLLHRNLAAMLLTMLGLTGSVAQAQIPPPDLSALAGVAGVDAVAGTGTTPDLTGPAPVLPAPLECDARKERMVQWTPRPSAVLSNRLRDDLWDESNLHGYLGPCDAMTFLPELDRIQAALQDSSHLDQLRCLWDLGLLGAARAEPVRNPATGTVEPTPGRIVDAVLAECSAAASAHQDGYLNDQVQALERLRASAAGAE